MPVTVLNMKNNFTSARFKLILLYLVIMASVVTLFSLLIMYQANDSFSDPAVQTGSEIITTAEEAMKIAQATYPDKVVAEVEYEIERGALYFTTTFTDETEVKLDLFTGVALYPEEETGLVAMLTDDFDEMVIWIGLFVFLIAALLSVYVANKTLFPIAENMERQKQFVSDAAHELRNPLSAMHARIESVLRNGGIHFTKDVLQDLLLETKRLITMSEYLLALEQAEHTKVNLVSIPLTASVNAVVKRLENMAQEKNIAIQIDVDTVPVALEKNDAEQVLYNLLHNAIKFTESGGHITITKKKSLLTIKNTGRGIQAKDIPHIFDRFYKADASRSEVGSGLGLALVSDTLKHYNAQIAVESVEGQGSTFTITFS
jgi:signal transduction histidine kinase